MKNIKTFFLLVGLLGFTAFVNAQNANTPAQNGDLQKLAAERANQQTTRQNAANQPQSTGVAPKTTTANVVHVAKPADAPAKKATEPVAKTPVAPQASPVTEVHYGPKAVSPTGGDRTNHQVAVSHPAAVVAVQPKTQVATANTVKEVNFGPAPHAAVVNGPRASQPVASNQPAKVAVTEPRTQAAQKPVAEVHYGPKAKTTNVQKPYTGATPTVIKHPEVRKSAVKAPKSGVK